MSDSSQLQVGNRPEGVGAIQTAPQYEEQFTAFIDFLGFREVSNQAEDGARLRILGLLLALSELRSEFDVRSMSQENGRVSQIRPAVSTFSDHIVISFPLERIARDIGGDDRVVPLLVTSQFNRLLRSIAAAALRLGFLIRGGATIGKLYHSRGVVFGEAMVEAFEIESRTAIYPRVVLSSRITSRPQWVAQRMDIEVGHDGLYHFDYFKMLMVSAASPGENHVAEVKTWFREVVDIVSQNLSDLGRDGRLNELSRWTWFSREFRRGLERLPQQLRDTYAASLDNIPWSS